MVRSLVWTGTDTTKKGEVPEDLGGAVGTGRLGDGPAGLGAGYDGRGGGVGVGRAGPSCQQARFCGVFQQNGSGVGGGVGELVCDGKYSTFACSNWSENDSVWAALYSIL